MIKRIGLRERLMLIFISAVFFVWFYQSVYQKVWTGKTLIVEDVRTKNIITLRKDFDRGAAKKLRLYLFGQIDGNAQITLSSETEKPEEYLLKPGNIQLRIDRKWEDPKCSLEYTPQNVKNGFLSLRYHFETEKK